MVTYAEMIAFAALIVNIIRLVIEIDDRKK